MLGRSCTHNTTCYIQNLDNRPLAGSAILTFQLDIIGDYFFGGPWPRKFRSLENYNFAICITLRNVHYERLLLQFYVKLKIIHSAFVNMINVTMDTECWAHGNAITFCHRHGDCVQSMIVVGNRMRRGWHFNLFKQICPCRSAFPDSYEHMEVWGAMCSCRTEVEVSWHLDCLIVIYLL